MTEDDRGGKGGDDRGGKGEDDRGGKDRMTEGEKALLAGRMRCGPYKDKKKDQIQRITTRTNCKG